MTTKTLHEIVPRTQACVDCGEDLEWLVEGNMSYRMLPDELVVWEIHTPAPEGFRDTVCANLRADALALARERFGSRAYVRRVPPAVPVAV